jgi:hypothetical protein
LVLYFHIFRTVIHADIVTDTCQVNFRYVRTSLIRLFAVALLELLLTIAYDHDIAVENRMI